MTILVDPSDFSDPSRPSLPGDPYIALVTRDAVTPLKIVKNQQTGVLFTLTETPVPPDPTATKISNLLMVRFAEAKLSWTYRTDAQAECKLKFIEQPDEYIAPQADLPEKAFCYLFTEQMPTPLLSRFTSYEDNVVIDGDVFTPAPFSHGAIVKGIKLDEEKIEISSFDFSLTSNPLRKLLEFSLEGILNLRVLEVNLSNPSAPPDVIFDGDAAGLDPKGKEWKATFRAFGQFFQRQFSRFYFQKICNVPVYSRKCGVVKANFLTASTLAAIATDGTYVEIANPAKPAAYFNLGHFETGAGVNYESRTIKSTTVSGPRLRLYFSKPLRKAVLNQAVNLYPGCDGSIDTCITRFNNQVNFRGFPYIPVKNPSANIGETHAQSGGKKG
jgi:uncharacterized phage protein (TIGR02218 family)